MPNHLLAAAASDSGKLPPNLLPAVVPLLVLILGLDAYCLIDLARAKSVRHMPKWVWVLVILFISAPIGALVYLFIGRDRGQDSGRDPAPARTGAAVAADAGAGDAAIALDAETRSITSQARISKGLRIGTAAVICGESGIPKD